MVVVTLVYVVVAEYHKVYAEVDTIDMQSSYQSEVCSCQNLWQSCMITEFILIVTFYCFLESLL